MDRLTMATPRTSLIYQSSGNKSLTQPYYSAELLYGQKLLTQGKSSRTVTKYIYCNMVKEL
jgi:hypothetical protein